MHARGTKEKLDLIIETTALTPNLIAALYAARAQSELICDRLSQSG